MSFIFLKFSYICLFKSVCFMVPNKQKYECKRKMIKYMHSETIDISLMFHLLNTFTKLRDFVQSNELIKRRFKRISENIYTVVAKKGYNLRRISIFSKVK